MHQGVLVEWTDTNPSNNTFEGTAREIFRVWLNTRSHQLGEVMAARVVHAEDFRAVPSNVLFDGFVSVHSTSTPWSSRAQAS